MFRVDVASGKVVRLTGNGHAGNVVPLPGGGAVFTQNSIMAPDDLFRVDAKGKVAQLTNVNQALLAELDPVSFEKFSFTGANGDQVWGYQDEARGASGKLPIAFVVHGGPQGSFGNGWSYRWNPRLLASPGYAVVSVDFHGSDWLRPGFHRRDPQQLGRLAARGPAEGPCLRHRQRRPARCRQCLRARRPATAAI